MGRIMVLLMRRALWVVFIFLFIPPVSAHTSLVSANPGDASIVAEAPLAISLMFDEELLILGDKNPNQIEVIDEAGNKVSGVATVNGPIISAPLTIENPGRYNVTYRVASGDGHVVTGKYHFTVASPEVITTAEEQAEDGSNLLIRVIWGLLILSAIGLIALLRFRK
jgi:methionine-rich copper-binding protein CopC